MSDCRLYLISPPHLSAKNFIIPLREALEGGDVASFQLRLKNVDDDAIRRATDLLRPIVQAAGTAFILNDRPDLAAGLQLERHLGRGKVDVLRLRIPNRERTVRRINPARAAGAGGARHRIAGALGHRNGLCNPAEEGVQHFRQGRSSPPNTTGGFGLPPSGGHATISSDSVRVRSKLPQQQNGKRN